jgi:hypothetical protein
MPVYPGALLFADHTPRGARGTSTHGRYPASEQLLLSRLVWEGAGSDWPHCESAVSQRSSKRTHDGDGRCGDVLPITDSETLETARTFPLVASDVREHVSHPKSSAAASPGETN